MNQFSSEERAVFDVTVRFVAGTAVVAVQGEINFVTAADLNAIIVALAETGRQRVVLDLGSCTFMGIDGSGIVASCAAALAPRGGRLLVRSALSLVEQPIDIVGLSNVDIEPAGAPPAGAAAVIPHAGGTDPPPRGPVAADEHFRQFTAIPAARDVVDSALRLVVSLARATIGGADGVSVTLNRQGRLTTVAASDKVVAAMDADQYETGEGPCVHAAVTGNRAHSESLRDESRWPAFTPRAVRSGINAIMSTPLLAAGLPAGALNIYSRTPNTFAEAEQELASSFAAHATTILTDAGVGIADGEVTERLSAVLRSREVIAQAQGILMSRDHVSPSEAYTVMRRSAVGGWQPLARVAAEVVASTQRPFPGQEPGARA
jgi:anti-anti-sigma factor